MGRPFNKDREERKILLKYFKRDSVIYSNFEKATKELTNEETIYYFIQFCIFRNSCDTFGGICSYSTDLPKEYQNLKNIDKVKHDYYSSLVSYSFYLVNNMRFRYQEKYEVSNKIDIDEIREILGEKRAEEAKRYGFGYWLYRLTDIEKDKLKKHIDNKPSIAETIIYRNYVLDSKFSYKHLRHNSLLVELDLTKDLKEINKYIQHLHEEYQKNKIKNVFDTLDIKLSKRNKEKIFSTNSHKPFNELLADKLFIYDAKKIGLTNKEIRKEIIRYSTVIKNNSKDEITETIMSNYYKSIKRFIKDEEYLKFLSGYD